MKGEDQVRRLHTLVQAGYVRQISRTEGYVVTERVLRLADGFHHSETVIQVACGHLDAFSPPTNRPSGCKPTTAVPCARVISPAAAAP